MEMSWVLSITTFSLIHFPFQFFLIHVVGCIIFSLMLLTLFSAKWENAIDPNGTYGRMHMLDAFLGVVIFVGIWFQCFIFACSKFLIGYVVGVWYFTT